MTVWKRVSAYLATAALTISMVMPSAVMAQPTQQEDVSGYELESVTIEAPTDILNTTLDPEGSIELSVVGTFVKDGEKKQVDLEQVPGAEVSYSSKTLYSTTTLNKPVATVVNVSEDGVVTGQDGGIGEVTVTAKMGGNGQEVSASKRFINRPFYREYEKTLTMKLFMNGDNNHRDAYDLCTFEEALELIKDVDNLTRGIPKIIYLVGWQNGGHDHCWPSWDPNQVDNDLKREEDPDGLTSLRWLIREARKYNTTVSLHLNLFDVSLDSPDFELYKEHDALAKDLDGNLLEKVESDGSVSEVVNHYMVCYTQAWEEGLFQDKIDALLEGIPELVEGGTIHVDAFHSYWFNSAKVDGKPTISPWHAAKYGYNEEMETDTQRKIFEYCREKGVDVTSEGVGFLRTNKFIGLQPMTWWSLGDLNQMEIPAQLYTGGQGNALRYGDNLHGEDIFVENMLAGREPTQGFLGRYCLSTLQFQYLNAQRRVSESQGVVTYTNGITATDNEVRQGDVIIRQGDNAFTPALWNEEYKEIIAYSGSGYTQKEWLLPQDWNEVQSVDLYNITKDGLQKIAQNIPVKDHKVALDLSAGQAVSVVPAGSAVEYIPGSFELATPQNGEKISVEGDTNFTWGKSEDAEAYRFVVANDAQLKDVVYETTVSSQQVSVQEFADRLEKDRKYYWGVFASSKEGAETGCWNNGQAFAFYTDTTKAPAAPEDLTIEPLASDKAKLTWKHEALGENSYEIYRKEAAAAEEEYVLLGTVTEPEFLDEQEFRSDVMYRYKVVAVNDAGTSKPVYATNSQIKFLSDLEMNVVYAPWGGPQKDTNQDTGKPAPITIGGVQYGKGLAFQPTTMASFALNGEYTLLKAVAGIDDKAGGAADAWFEFYFDKSFTEEENFNGSKQNDDKVTILDTTEVPDAQSDKISKGKTADVTVDVTGVKSLTVYLNPNGRTWDDWGSLANAYLEMGHVHTAQHVDAAAATCTQDGNTEYWHCTTCDRYFADAECTQEIFAEDTVVAKLQHAAVKTEAKAATCVEDGNIEYWHCTLCGKYFRDAECAQEIAQEDTIIRAAHSAVQIPAKAPTCTEDGNIEYWYCEVCGKCFTDASCTQELAKEDVVLKAEGHTVVHTQAKNATCTESGNIEYWYCNVCEKYFRDANCTTEIQKADVFVKPMGHDWNSAFTTDKEPTATQEGQKSVHCKRCDATKDIVVLPALGEETDQGAQIPQTGDNRNPIPAAVVTILSIAGAMYTFKKLKKNS